MKNLLSVLTTAILLSSPFIAQAEYPVNEFPLNRKKEAYLATSIGEALRNKRITQQQYEQSIGWLNKTPCDGVDRSLTARRKIQLETAIANEQRQSQVKVFDSFRIEGWSIVFTDAGEGDEPYLFYHAAPELGSHPVAAWSGTATIFETDAMIMWVHENVPGIPDRLAHCFAWHVTLGHE